MQKGPIHAGAMTRRPDAASAVGDRMDVPSAERRPPRRSRSPREQTAPSSGTRLVLLLALLLAVPLLAPQVEFYGDELAASIWRTTSSMATTSPVAPTRSPKVGVSESVVRPGFPLRLVPFVALHLPLSVIRPRPSWSSSRPCCSSGCCACTSRRGRRSRGHDRAELLEGAPIDVRMIRLDRRTLPYDLGAEPFRRSSTTTICKARWRRSDGTG